MNSLILIRHGQSLWNKERRFTGWADIDLTEQGKKEAKHAGELIKELNIKFDAFFTSSLKRASNSLDIILQVLKEQNTTITKTFLLAERHYGNLTSLNKDEIIKKYGSEQVQIWRRSFSVKPPPMEDGHPYKKKINSNTLSESLEDTCNRVLPFYKEKVEPLIYSQKNVLIVFHGNTCRALLMKIFNISETKINELEIPTGNPLLIRFDKNTKVQDYKYLDKTREKKILFNT